MRSFWYSEADIFDRRDPFLAAPEEDRAPAWPPVRCVCRALAFPAFLTAVSITRRSASVIG